MGKTEFGLYLLKKAGCQKPIIAPNLKYLNHVTDYDGVFFDECVQNDLSVPTGNEGHLKIEEQIKLVDTVHTSSLKVRYGHVILPPNVPRILSTNNLTRCIDVTHPAVERRVTVVEVMEPLYKTQ